MTEGSSLLVACWFNSLWRSHGIRVSAIIQYPLLGFDTNDCDSRKGSVPSLVAGSAISALYLTAGYLLKNNMEYGIHTALGASTLMFMGGINRMIMVKGGIRKPVPIMLTVIGGFSTYYYAAKYSEFYR